MINSELLTQPQQILLALLKLALWNTLPDKALLDKADEAIWKKVFQFSVDQGVIAVAFDGIMLLPAELQPPRSIKLPWAINVESLERRYDRQLAVANELSGIFSKNNIKMLLFKGVGLSEYYPVPKHREFGDIDIYLFEKHEEGNQLLVQYGARKDENNLFKLDKHSTLHYKGFSVENHKHFLFDEFPQLKMLEDRLLQTLESTVSPIGKILFPPPDFNVLFLMCHTLGHFIQTPLTLRSFCDWSLFLKASQGKIDFAVYRQLMADSGLLTLADAFTALTIKYIGLDPELTPSLESNPIIENKMMRELLNPLSFLKTEKMSALKVISYKTKALKARRWKYELFYPKHFWKSVLKSIIFHIQHPQVIMKLK